MIGAITRARRRWRLARYWQTRGDLTEAGRHARHAVRLAERCPAPPLLVTEILLTAAEVHRDLADYPTAATHWAEAAALLDRTAAVPGRDRLLVRALTGLGDAHRRAGDHVAAATALNRAIALAAGLVPADPMLPAAALTLAGIVAKEIGAFDTAQRYYAEVDRLLDRATAGLAEKATLAHNLAGLAYARGDADTAVREAKRAVTLREGTGNELDLAQDLAVLAAALATAGRPAAALPHLERALAACRSARPVRDYEVSVQLHTRASIRHDLGDRLGAERDYRASLAARRRLLGPDHPEVALIAHNLAVLAGERNRGRGAAGRRHRPSPSQPPVEPDATA
jgi:tetratricopeptide (TPR) repeat protein